MIRILPLLLSAALLLAPSALAAQAEGACTATIPTPSGWVNDFAEVIPDSIEPRLLAIVQEVRAGSWGEIVVVTLPSLQGCTEAQMGLRLGREWGIGFDGAADDPRTSTGVVLLVVPSERKARIEVGIGATRFISDEQASEILQTLMFPEFRRGDIGAGVLKGMRAIACRFAERFNFALDAEPCR